MSILLQICVLLYLCHCITITHCVKSTVQPTTLHPSTQPVIQCNNDTISLIAATPTVLDATANSTNITITANTYNVNQTYVVTIGPYD